MVEIGPVVFEIFDQMWCEVGRSNHRKLHGVIFWISLGLTYFHEQNSERCGAHPRGLHHEWEVSRHTGSDTEGKRHDRKRHRAAAFRCASWNKGRSPEEIAKAFVDIFSRITYRKCTFVSSCPLPFSALAMSPCRSKSCCAPASCFLEWLPAKPISCCQGWGKIARNLLFCHTAAHCCPRVTRTQKRKWATFFTGRAKKRFTSPQTDVLRGHFRNITPLTNWPWAFQITRLFPGEMYIDKPKQKAVRPLFSIKKRPPAASERVFFSKQQVNCVSTAYFDPKQQWQRCES